MLKEWRESGMCLRRRCLELWLACARNLVSIAIIIYDLPQEEEE